MCCFDGTITAESLVLEGIVGANVEIVDREALILDLKENAKSESGALNDPSPSSRVDYV